MGRGIIYILTNDRMPGLVKIGITTSLEQRMRDLDTTGVPVPFRAYAALEIDNYEKIERLIHDQFQDSRVRGNREFFEMDAERAFSTLQMLKTANPGETFVKVDDDMIGEGGAVSDDSVKKTRRPTLTFEMLNIPKGAELVFVRDSSLIATVISDKQMEFHGELFSLTGLAKKLLEEDAESTGNYSNIRGASYFKYNGVTLAELYERHFEEDDDV
ncbi:GIY-YIG nuclease family protein [Weissella confusa]|uniref:GIY-YIG nuclease family protein n=1 Tax=Weissella confusa TaxID=1583 RepID=UPI00107F5BA9|nr:GIY-YIG nuclease family protein [Weissella confusa]TGE77346.1 hypothetical protein C6P10_04715 [Weissella confusa]